MNMFKVFNVMYLCCVLTSRFAFGAAAPSVCVQPKKIDDIPILYVNVIKAARDLYSVDAELVLSVEKNDKNILKFLSKPLIGIVNFGFDFCSTFDIDLDITLQGQVFALESVLDVYKKRIQELKSGWNLTPLQRISFSEVTKNFGELNRDWYFFVKKYYTGHECCTECDVISTLIDKFKLNERVVCLVECGPEELQSSCCVSYLLIRKNCLELFRSIFGFNLMGL